jgi:hypothetical protein
MRRAGSVTSSSPRRKVSVMESAPLLRMISMATGKTPTSQQRARDAEVCTKDFAVADLRRLAGMTSW